MVEQAVKPFIMRNAIVQLGTDDFAAAVSRAELVPSGGTSDFKGLKTSAVFTYPQATTWALELDYAQDWGTSGSLSSYLFDHIGEVVPAVIDPDDLSTSGGTSWACEVAITAGAVGGAVDAVATASVSLGVVGQPVPTYTPATP
jgi:hypothetical protein